MQSTLAGREGDLSTVGERTGPPLLTGGSLLTQTLVRKKLFPPKRRRMNLESWPQFRWGARDQRP